MKVLNEIKNSLLSRKEVQIELNHSGIAPKKETIINDIAKQFKSESNLIVVKGMIPSFGTNNLDIKAYVYESLEMLKKIERIKNGKGKKAKK